jgi:hypothetical protein
VPSIGAPYTGDVTAAPFRGHVRRDANGRFVAPSARQTDSSEHGAGVAAVLSYKLADGALYESNNAPYINQLNLGHSNQAPVGFVETAIDQALAKIQARYDGIKLDITTSGAGTFSDAAGGGAAENLAEAYSPL